MNGLAASFYPFIVLQLAVVLQFMENLSDREAADAVRGWIDWKHALSWR